VAALKLSAVSYQLSAQSVDLNRLKPELRAESFPPPGVLRSSG
jgi:hypothetical protein